MKRFQSPVLAAIAALLLVVATTRAADAQTYSVLYNLGTKSADPLNPAWIGTFAQGRDGNLYSTTPGGGANAFGAVFKLTPSGTMTELYSFSNGNDGAFPNSGLTLGTDGSLYGTASVGGSGFGTVFKITTSGTFTPLHSFNGGTEGLQPNAPPIQGIDGNFYGTTSNGFNTVFGTAYKMTPLGVLTVIHTFDTTLRYPYALTLGSDGNFYGTAGGGSGNAANGAVFKMTPQGKVTVLHNFTGTDGQAPDAAIIQASDGNFYGTTRGGGSGGAGVVYKMTPTGVLTVLFNFANNGLGMNPWAGLVQATDGKFYGATITNPGVSFGVLFQITSVGAYSVLVGFTNNIGKYPGGNPQVSLFQHTNGTLYGDTAAGGTGNMGCITCGVLYSLSMGLGPFVRFLPPQSSGKAGKTIEFLGQGFSGTTSVMFGTGSASFTVVSDTYMTAKVPTTGTTGYVTVITPSRTLTSSRTFKVLPAVTSFTPTSGPVGTTVTITGSGFVGATKLTFGGVQATSYTVNSGTQITATVPTGAKTGNIAVTTPGGSASKGTFTVF